MTSASIVVVTGANRGIAFEISPQLANRGAEVILSARKPEVGKAAVKKLAALNLTGSFNRSMSRRVRALSPYANF
jgi:NAD(P)-dependent dehydrogenase (short-subunit alcohol dehydrogenase family)